MAACGSGVGEVQASRLDDALLVDLRWPAGYVARYVLADTPLSPNYAVTVVGDGEVCQLVPEFGGLYQALLRTALPYLAGLAPAARPYREVIEPERICLAAAVSLKAGGRWVSMDDPDLVSSRFDAAEFTINYREQRLASR